MAGEAFGDIAMGLGMAEGTGKGGVRARVVCHLLFRRGVTGDTDLLLIADNTDFQRLMGVVAADARFGDFVVGTSRMAVAAGRNVVLRNRAMSLMALLAIDFSLMGTTICGDLLRFLAVAFDTVID